jgi:hypothetical protein
MAPGYHRSSESRVGTTAITLGLFAALLTWSEDGAGMTPQGRELILHPC